LANNFFLYTFFKLFPRIWNQRKILRFLYSYVKKEIKNFWGHGVHIWVFFENIRMQIRKKWLNQLKNFFNKHFKEYHLTSFCWWIPSSCENHCNLVFNSTVPNIRGHFVGYHFSNTRHDKESLIDYLLRKILRNIRGESWCTVKPEV
jgi:hypothetical protein